MQFTDVFNYTAGKHSIAAGAELFRLAQGDQGNNGQRGTFTFTGEISGNAAADFLLGFPRNVTTPAPSSVQVSARQWRNAFFVSDKWSVSSKLTLTIGLRYELPTVASVADRHRQRSQRGGNSIDSREQSPLLSAAHRAIERSAA